MTTPSDRLLLLNIGNPSRLLSISSDGEDIQTLVADLGVAPDGIAIDPVHRYIFWTYMGTSHDGEDFFVNDGSIERVDFDGRIRTTVVAQGRTFTPKQMQCDVEHGFIYWCDREGMRARLDGSDVTVLVQTGTTESERHDRRRHCVGVAVDSVDGFFTGLKKANPTATRDESFGHLLSCPKVSIRQTAPTSKYCLTTCPSRSTLSGFKKQRSSIGLIAELHLLATHSTARLFGRISR